MSATTDTFKTLAIASRALWFGNDPEIGDLSVHVSSDLYGYLTAHDDGVWEYLAITHREASQHIAQDRVIAAVRHKLRIDEEKLKVTYL
jgi:hypothetical protein